VLKGAALGEQLLRNQGAAKTTEKQSFSSGAAKAAWSSSVPSQLWGQCVLDAKIDFSHRPVPRLAPVGCGSTAVWQH